MFPQLHANLKTLEDRIKELDSQFLDGIYDAETVEEFVQLTEQVRELRQLLTLADSLIVSGWSDRQRLIFALLALALSIATFWMT